MIQALLQTRAKHKDARLWGQWAIKHHAEKPWSSLYSPEDIKRAQQEVDRLRGKWGVLFSAFLRQVRR